MQQEISSGSLTAFPRVGHLQRKEGKWKRENGWLWIFSKAFSWKKKKTNKPQLIHKHLNFHQRKWLIFSILLKNTEKSVKHFNFRWKSPLSEVQYIFFKKYEVANTEAWHLPKTYLYIWFGKQWKSALCFNLGQNFLSLTFSQDKEHCPPALTDNHPFYTMAQGGSARWAIGILGYACTTEEKVARGRSSAPHSSTLQLALVCSLSSATVCSHNCSFLGRRAGDGWSGHISGSYATWQVIKHVI